MKSKAKRKPSKTLAELIADMRKHGRDYCEKYHYVDCMCGPAMQITSGKLADFYTRAKAMAKKWENNRTHTYASENADHYRGFDNGQLRAAQSLLALLGELK